MREKIIKIHIDNLLEIPLAYKLAIERYKASDELSSCGNYDIWDAKIELLAINFQSNFRRTEYECVLKITEGNFEYEK